MGYLPPNVASDDPQRFPAGRMVELRRRPTSFTGGPFPGWSPGIPAGPASPWFTGTSRFTHYNEVVYDYQSSPSRVGQSAGSGPFVRGGPGDGYIYVTAPIDRPLPYIAWARTMYRPQGAVVPPSVFSYRFAIVRSNPANETVDYLVLDEFYEVDSYNFASAAWTPSCFGFDVVPPGQTYQVWTGGDRPGSGVLIHMFDDGTQSASQNFRHHFGVMTF